METSSANCEHKHSKIERFSTWNEQITLSSKLNRLSVTVNKLSDLQ